MLRLKPPGNIASENLQKSICSKGPRENETTGFYQKVIQRRSFANDYITTTQKLQETLVSQNSTRNRRFLGITSRHTRKNNRPDKKIVTENLQNAVCLDYRLKKLPKESENGISAHPYGKLNIVAKLCVANSCKRKMSPSRKDQTKQQVILYETKSN